jgi:hypothetical protein
MPRLTSILCILIFFTINFSSSFAQEVHPYLLELHTGAGQLSQSGTSTAFQPGIGFTYLPGSFGIGFQLNFMDDQGVPLSGDYGRDFESLTTLSGSDLWNSLSLNLGPRFDIKASRQLRVRGGLDFSLIRTQAPDEQILFNAPNSTLNPIVLRDL